MDCCDIHDRMDKVLKSDEVNSRKCGVPTNPRGERRYCCLDCPTQGKTIEDLVEPEWVQNPFLSRFVHPEVAGRYLANTLDVGIDPRVHLTPEAVQGGPGTTQT